jgi:hypothetical protein
MITDPSTALDAGERMFEAVKKKFGAENVRFDTYRQSSSPNDFPVLIEDLSVRSSLALSEVLVRLPLTAIDFVFCARDKADEVREWISANQVDILRAGGGGS